MPFITHVFIAEEQHEGDEKEKKEGDEKEKEGDEKEKEEGDEKEKEGDVEEKKKKKEKKSKGPPKKIEVEEFFVKYRSFSYLHCEWRTEEELFKGDKRINGKIKRYKQKRAMSQNVMDFVSIILCNILFAY